MSFLAKREQAGEWAFREKEAGGRIDQKGRARGCSLLFAVVIL